MAKKQPAVVVAAFKKVTVEDVMGDRFSRYSKYIIQERALPDVRDGLKPVQRRILYAMYKEGNHFDKAYRKSAKTVGIVIGNYHPHGDSSVYEAMVRLSQSWKVNCPLVDMQGNNGSIDDDPAAAMRYTEARLSKLAHHLLSNIDEDVVPFVLNFDDTDSEPVVLPASFCNLLVNGATGIAAGYATNIPPFNFNEIMEATMYRLQFPECTLDEIAAIVKGPDFPTGGIIQGATGIQDILKTGRGKVVVRSAVEVVETKTVRQLVISEIPYEVIKSNLVRRIDEYRMNQNLDAILDVRDESDRNGLRIVIDVKKDADYQTILNLLYKNTELQVNYNANMITIINKRPELCGILTVLDAYLSHRKEITLKRSQYRVAKMEKRTHILQGLIKAVSILDEVIAIIRASNSKAEAKERLIEAFEFSEVQAEAILMMQLYRLSNTDIVQMREEFAQLVNQIEYLEQVLQNEDMLKNMIVSELKELQAAFSFTRRSKIEAEVSELEVDRKSLISNDRVIVNVSFDGYIKRTSLRSYNSSDSLDVALKEGDHPVLIAEVETLDNLVLVTQKGQYLIIPVYEITEMKWKDIGNHISSLVKIDGGDRILTGFSVKNFETGMCLTTVTRQGMIKRTLIRDLLVTRLNKSYTIMNLKANDQLVSAYISHPHDQMIIVSKTGYAVNLTADQVSIQAPKAQGVKGINLKDKDSVADSCAVFQDHQAIAVFTDRKTAKRIKASDISLKSRPVMGELIAKRVQSNPSQVTQIISGDLQDIIRIYDDKIEEYLMKDVVLMTPEQTYSNAVPGGIVIRPCVDVPVIAIENHEEEKIEKISFEL